MNIYTIDDSLTWSLWSSSHKYGLLDRGLREHQYMIKIHVTWPRQTGRMKFVMTWKCIPPFTGPRLKSGQFLVCTPGYMYQLLI